MSTSRMLAAVLATAALAAPTAATARPPDMHASTATAGTPQQPAPKLHVSAFTGQAAPMPPADTTVYVQPQELAPVDEQSAASSGSTDQRPIIPAPAANVSDGGSGIDWTTIALGIAGILLAVSGIAALTNRRNRRQRALGATD